VNPGDPDGIGRSVVQGGFDAKRAFDLGVSGAALLLTWPVLAIIAVAVRLDSKGPAFFRQERVGLHGRTFRIHKFRSLRTGVPGALISPTDDPRTTRIGSVLRRTKLDELPQLLDVLAGHMSLVGPRPEVPRYVAMWPEADRRLILSVRPGMTDPASIALRNEADELAATEDSEAHYVTSLLPRKTAIYADYVRTRNFLGDLAIIARTLRTVVTD
jgi:lipopolysaccharide/colanic/teichoic acid biosynthesis glycosyltransferase